jgi:serine/threonine protein kinase
MKICIADFGFSRKIEKQGLKSRLKGTPGYIAPEIFSDSLSYSMKSDIFSIGSIMYNILTGSNLFKGDSVKSVILMNKECNLDLAKDNLKWHDNNLTNLVLQMLSKDLKERPTAR